MMLRLFTDFQAAGADGSCWILRYEDMDIQIRADELKLAKGDKVILDAHEGFVVVGMLDYKYVELLGRDAWVAYPDWSTRIEGGQR